MEKNNNQYMPYEVVHIDSNESRELLFKDETYTNVNISCSDIDTNFKEDKNVSRKCVYASNNKEAIKYLKEKQGKDIINKNDGTVVRFGSNGRNKMISNKARGKSLVNGFSPIEHNTAVANIDILFAASKLISETDDKNGYPDVKIRRYEVSIKFIPSDKKGYADLLVKKTALYGNTL